MCGRVDVTVLIIKPKWLQMIMDGRKTWEIRRGRSHKDGQTIYLVASGTGAIYARATFVTSHGPLTQDEWKASGKRVRTCMGSGIHKGPMGQPHVHGNPRMSR